MTETVRINVAANIDPLLRALGTAGERLEALATPAAESARFLERAFRSGLGNVEDALVRAAATGELSFGKMVDAIIADLARLAIRTFVTDPLMDFAKNLIGNIGFGGARAGGGPVSPRHAYLVGERGPEMFVPGASGAIAPIEGQARATTLRPSVTLNVNTNDAASFMRGEAQIAAAMMRALARSRRNL